MLLQITNSLDGIRTYEELLDATIEHNMHKIGRSCKLLGLTLTDGEVATERLLSVAMQLIVYRLIVRFPEVSHISMVTISSKQITRSAGTNFSMYVVNGNVE